MKSADDIEFYESESNIIPIKKNGVPRYPLTILSPDHTATTTKSKKELTVPRKRNASVNVDEEDDTEGEGNSKMQRTGGRCHDPTTCLVAPMLN